MKRSFILISCVLLAAALLAGCGSGSGDSASGPASSSKSTALTNPDLSIFSPQDQVYDFTTEDTFLCTKDMLVGTDIFLGSYEIMADDEGGSDIAIYASKEAFDTGKEPISSREYMRSGPAIILRL